MLRFVGDGDQKKFPKNSRQFSMRNCQASTKKKFTKFFWRADKVTIFALVVAFLVRKGPLGGLGRGWVG